jgi:hypothetical protein
VLVVYDFQQSLNSSLHLPFMVFVTQITVCELIFQAVSNCVGFCFCLDETTAPFSSRSDRGLHTNLPIGNSEVLLATLYKSPGRTWKDAEITELLSFRYKSILADDLNAKHPFWNSAVSNPSGEKLMALFDLSFLTFFVLVTH